MWSELRADAVRRELTALADARLPIADVHAHALESIARVVPFDAACVGAVDPETLLLTSGVTIGFAPSVAESERFTEIEYGGVERSSFSNLVDRQLPVLADGGASAPVRRHDLRYHELVKLIGFTHDVRIACMTDASCWAVGDLYRSGTSAGFDEREVAFLEQAAFLVATATRMAVRRSTDDAGALPDGAAVIVIDGAGSVSGMTEAARRWLDGEHGRDLSSPLWWALNTAVATARRGAPTAYTRVRIAGTWLVVRASSLGPDATTYAPVAVTIDEASARDLADLLMAAHGITKRERDVCHEVLAGRSTREIAERLFIAPHTVQDHLKSIFAKTGVNSRRELVASFGG